MSDNYTAVNIPGRWIMEKDAEITRLRAELAAVTEERDALAARLALVEDDALVEIVAREIAFAQGDVESPNSEFMDENWHCWEPEARAAIAAIRPHIEAAALSDLVEFSKHKNWTLKYKMPFCCDDDDQEQCWVVYEEIGSINDRDWDDIGKGKTAAEAIADALKHER